MQTIVYQPRLAKVYPVHEEMERRRVRHGEEQDGVVGWTGQEPREAVGGDGEAGGGWDEIEGAGAAEESAEVGGVGREVVCVKLLTSKT